MVKMSLFVTFLILSSCATVTGGQELDAKKNYRMSLDLEVNGQRSNGMLVVPPAQKYVIRVRPSNKDTSVLLTSCHRELSMNQDRREFTYEFTPTSVEREGFCPLSIAVFSQKLWYEGGMVVTKEGGWALPATLLCNGVTSQETGVSACQSRAGLIQRVTFPVQVQAGSGKCGALYTKDSLSFEIRPQSGQCAWVFKEKVGTREHLLTTFGYDQFISP